MRSEKNVLGPALLFGLLIILLAITQVVKRNQVGQMQIQSPAFSYNQAIPEKYTCDGENVSPPLYISNVPEGALSLALTVFDPDAGSNGWTHWTVWDIDPTINTISEGAVVGTEGVTSFGKNGYGGPCPPSGVHRYVFTVYALDVQLGLGERAQPADLESDLQGHILSKAELIGLYTREE